MNILYISNTSKMYGANTSLLDILMEMQCRKCNVVVAVMKNAEIKKELISRGIKTYEVDYTTNCGVNININEKLSKLAINLKAMLCLKEIVYKEKIDIVHSNASNIDVGAMVSLVCRIPHIWHIREMLYQHYGLKYDFPLLTKFFLKKAKRKIAISNYVKNDRNFDNNTYVVYDGFNIEKYDIKREEYLNNEKLRILYCGVLSHQKGIMDVVKSIHYLVYKEQKEVELYIASDFGMYCKRIQKYVRNHNLKDYIHFCGYQKDLYKLRSECDVAVMTSRSEALGRVTIEGMLSELLVVGAEAGATKEIIKNGVTGILYTPGDIKQLANILLNIKKDKEKSIEIIKTAKKYALNNFDIKKHVDKLLYIYQEIIQ